jgi:hypothetical protein
MPGTGEQGRDDGQAGKRIVGAQSTLEQSMWGSLPRYSKTRQKPAQASQMPKSAPLAGQGWAGDADLSKRECSLGKPKPSAQAGADISDTGKLKSSA